MAALPEGASLIYDPATDPRFLGEETEPEDPIDLDTHHRLTEELKMLDERLEVLSSSAYEVLQPLFEAWLREAASKLMNGRLTQEDIYRQQGRVSAFRDVLSLRKESQQRQGQVRDELAEYQKPADGGEPE